MTREARMPGQTEGGAAAEGALDRWARLAMRALHASGAVVVLRGGRGE